MLKLPKQLLKSVILVDADGLNRLEYSTMQFKDARVEQYMLKLALSLRGLYPRESKLMISSIKHKYYQVERCTSNNQKVVRCDFRTPRFHGRYDSYDSHNYDDCGCTDSWIQIEIIPTLNIYEIHIARSGYWGDISNMSCIIFNDRLLRLSNKDKGYLDHYKDTYWEIIRLRDEQTGKSESDYWTKRKAQQTVTYEEVFNLYCQHNNYIEFKEDL